LKGLRRQLPNIAAGPRRRRWPTKQRDISVSEFFAKNRHLLGFDNPRKALLTTVKEAVDNSLDACEEAGIIPEIWVHIETTGTNRFKVARSGQRPWHRQEADPADFRQAAVRFKVPPVADEPRAAGNWHQRRLACTAC
jgi:DNA topoisomerase-6 subunit B